MCRRDALSPGYHSAVRILVTLGCVVVLTAAPAHAAEDIVLTPYVASGQAAERLAQRCLDLFPWVDENTRVVLPDLWLDGDTDFRQGGITFRVIYTGGAHAPDDLLEQEEFSAAPR
jgi:hypothetical protein